MFKFNFRSRDFQKKLNGRNSILSHINIYRQQFFKLEHNCEKKNLETMRRKKSFE